MMVSAGIRGSQPCPDGFSVLRPVGATHLYLKPIVSNMSLSATY